MNRSMRGATWVAAFAALALTLAGCANKTETSSESAPNAPAFPVRPATETVMVSAGTLIQVVLDQTISTGSAEAGQQFDATVIQPVIVGGKTVIARDARAKGHIVEAESSGRLTHRAHLALTLDSVEVGGKAYDIHTTTIARASSSHKKRNLEIIGGGTALGAIIGGIAGGGKGAAIGAAAGAGGGTAAAAATGKKRVTLPAESRLTFRLTEPVKVEISSKTAK